MRIPAALPLLFLAPWTHGQTVLLTMDGDEVNQYLGVSVSSVGDLTGDGTSDYLVGAPGLNSSALDSARLYSGADGSLLHTFSDGQTQNHFGASSGPAGDVDADGIGDLLIGAASYSGAGEPGTACVYSGADFGLLYSFSGDAVGDRFGISVSTAGDVNADGFDDVVIGSTEDYARVFSGSDGTLLHEFVFVGPFSSGNIRTVAAAGDLDGDGFDDVLIGTPLANRADVFSGFDGSTLHEFLGTDPVDRRLGNAVASAGDVDADGVPDLIVGMNPSNSASTAPGARVYSGADGSVLYTVFGDDGSHQFGEAVSSAGDVNADGHDDFLVGARLEPNNAVYSGSVRLYSGATGELLYSIFGGPDEQLGSSLAPVGDSNGDGYDDFIVGAPAFDTPTLDAGRATVYSGRDLSVVPYCFGDGSDGLCPCLNLGGAFEGCENSTGSAGQLTNLGSTSLAANDLGFQAALPPGRPCILIVGTDTNAIGGDGIPFGDGLGCIGGVTMRLEVTSSDASGRATWGPNFGLPIAWSVWDTRHFQAVYRDVGGPCGTGINLTNALRLTLQP